MDQNLKKQIKPVYNGQVKPVVSYWRNSDPTKKIDILRQKLTDINIIETKNLTDEFVKFCLENKHRIYLHIVINGMGSTIFEPAIPTVKQMFIQLKTLIDNGFQQKQILVVVKPILPNNVGLSALKLLLRLFTEFKALRLRFIRFNVLTYTENNGKYIIGNQNINNRPAIKQVMNYLVKSNSFWTEYYKLIEDYKAIISVDSNEEALIGVRELMAFGYTNSWKNENGQFEKIINYERGNKFKPIVNIISPKPATRCSNRCLLCPYRY